MIPPHDDAIRAAIARARRLTESEPEPFRALAFRTVLEHLLRGSTAPPSAGDAPPPSVDMDLTEFLASKKAATHPDRVVAIAYRVVDCLAELTVTDDGAGLPPGFDADRDIGLGLPLLTSVIGQDLPRLLHLRHSAAEEQHRRGRAKPAGRRRQPAAR